MGTYNIVNVEVRKPGGKWEHCTKFPEGVFIAKNADAPFEYQSYVLFCLIANVRNEGQGIIPLAEPRGLPKDVSKSIQELYKGVKNPKPEDGFYWGWNEYSDPEIDPDRWGGTTHFTIQDLLKYPYYDRTLMADSNNMLAPDTTLRMHLGLEFFQTLEAFKNWSEYTPENVRVIMSFD